MGGELEALRLASGERVGGLAELEIVEADVDELLEADLDFGLAAEEAERFAGGHGEHIGNAFAAVFGGEDFFAVAGAAALAALLINVGHELHVDLQRAFALAGGAAAGFDVEAEMAGAVVVRTGFDGFGKNLANGIEGFDVGDGVDAGGAADGGLIDEDAIVDLAAADKVVVRQGRLFDGADEALADRAVERVLDERAFARAADTADDAEHVEREFDGEIFEVVAAGAIELEPAVGGGAAVFWDGNAAAAG